MGEFFREFIKRTRRVRLFVSVFVLAVIAEEGSRALARRPISIMLADDLKATVDGNVYPDFLWVGDAWFISITCGQPIAVEIDGKWKANVPAGEHKIYHNHDSNNTTKYSATPWTSPPTNVTVRKP